MAKNSTRTKMKDELTAAVNNLDWYIAKLDKIFETYAEVHPDIALGAAMAIKSAIMLKEFTENINKEI